MADLDDDLQAAEPPTLEELLEPTIACIKCGSESVRIDSPASRYVLIVGGLASAWVLYLGAVSPAIGLLFVTVTLAAGMRKKFHFRHCDRCGHEWHRAEELTE